MTRPAAALLLLAAVLPAAALEVPPRPQARVNDYAGVLPADVERRIEASLAAYEGESTNQVAVAVFRSLEGEDPEGFSIRLARAWQLGQGDRDNGVLLAVFLEDRKVRIEVGRGLEGALTDLESGRILSEVIRPRFRQGDFAGGIEQGAAAIVAGTKGEFTAPPRRKGTGGRLPGPVILFLVIFAIWMAGAVRRAMRMGTGTVYTPYGRRAVRRRPTIWWGGGGFGGGFGGGGFGGGGGGFRGGGGSFGGGGATGSW